jgi:hypothetical protein
MRKTFASGVATVALLSCAGLAYGEQSGREFMDEAIRTGSTYYGTQTDKLTDETNYLAMIAIRQHGAVYVFVFNCKKAREVTIGMTVRVFDAAMERELAINPSPLGGRCVQFRMDTDRPFADCGNLSRDQRNEVRFSISGVNSAGFYGAPNAGRNLLNSQRLLIKGIYSDEVVEIATKFSDEFKGQCINVSAREEERQAEEARRRREEHDREIRRAEETRKRSQEKYDRKAKLGCYNHCSSESCRLPKEIERKCRE